MTEPSEVVALKELVDEALLAAAEHDAEGWRAVGVLQPRDMFRVLGKWYTVLRKQLVPATRARNWAGVVITTTEEVGRQDMVGLDGEPFTHVQHRKFFLDVLTLAPSIQHEGGT